MKIEDIIYDNNNEGIIFGNNNNNKNNFILNINVNLNEFFGDKYWK